MSRKPYKFLFSLVTRSIPIIVVPISHFVEYPAKGIGVGDDSVSLVSLRLKTTSGVSDEETTKIKEKERFEVWRRYSEFDSLRTFLCTIYPHVSRTCNLIM